MSLDRWRGWEFVAASLGSSWDITIGFMDYITIYVATCMIQLERQLECARHSITSTFYAPFYSYLLTLNPCLY
jgi:hypothetical protein